MTRVAGRFHVDPTGSRGGPTGRVTHPSRDVDVVTRHARWTPVRRRVPPIGEICKKIRADCERAGRRRESEIGAPINPDAIGDSRDAIHEKEMTCYVPNPREFHLPAMPILRPAPPPPYAPGDLPRPPSA